MRCGLGSEHYAYRHAVQRWKSCRPIRYMYTNIHIMCHVYPEDHTELEQAALYITIQSMACTLLATNALFCFALLCD